MNVRHNKNGKFAKKRNYMAIFTLITSIITLIIVVYLGYVIYSVQQDRQVETEKTALRELSNTNVQWERHRFV